MWCWLLLCWIPPPAFVFHECISAAVGAPCRCPGFDQRRIKHYQFFQKIIVFEIEYLFKDIIFPWQKYNIRRKNKLFNLLRFGKSVIGGDQLLRKNAMPRIYYATSPSGDVAGKEILQIMGASLFDKTHLNELLQSPINRNVKEQKCEQLKFGLI